MAMAKVTTPEFRVSFPAVFKSVSFEGGPPKYGVVMMFPKGTNLDAMRDLARAAASEKWPDPATRPEQLRSPFRDGDTDKADRPEYADIIFVAAKSNMKPGVVDQDVQAIISEEVSPEGFYAGCYAIATVTAYGYDTAGNKGVAFGLQNIQKQRDGEPFSGRADPSEEFEAVASDAGSADGVTKEADFLN